MHELSVASNIVEIAHEQALAAGVERVTRVTLRIGALSCIHRHALERCFPIACEGTIVDGADLTVIEVPVSVHCPECKETSELHDIQPLACQRCGLPTGDVRGGHELEIESIEVIEVID